MKYLILPILILISNFSMGQNDEVQPPVIGIKVPLGESVVINGITIKFLEVLEDSRCPKGVNCIWAGRAIVKVEVIADGKKEEKTLIIGATRPGEDKNTNLYNSTKFSINGLTLNPYPTAEHSEDTSYILVVSEDKKE